MRLCFSTKRLSDKQQYRSGPADAGSTAAFFDGGVVHVSFRYRIAWRCVSDKKEYPAPESGRDAADSALSWYSPVRRLCDAQRHFDSCRFGCGFLRCGGYRRTMVGKSRSGDRSGMCGEPISSRGRPHKSNRHCTESGKSDHGSGGCTERRCPCCPRRQSCRGCMHGRWLSRRLR